MNIDIDKFRKAAPCAPYLMDKDETFKANLMLLRTMTAAPFYSQLALSEVPIFPTLDVEIAATDEYRVYINPRVLFVHYTDPDEWVFVECHEVMHVVNRDCSIFHMYDKIGHVMCPDGKSRPFNWEVANWAGDFRINRGLVLSRIGKKPKDCLYDEDMSDGTEDFATVYMRTWDKYVKETPGQGVSGGRDQGQGVPTNGNGGPAGTTMKGFDMAVKPGALTGKEPSKERDVEMEMAVASAAQAAALAGNLPLGVERMIQRAKVRDIPWHEKVRATLARRSGGGGWNFRASDRRLIQRGISVPRRSSLSCGTIVIGQDVSGSITDPQVAVFNGHMATIFKDLRPKEIVVIWCDAKVQRVDRITSADELEAMTKKPVPGGGGTRMTPVFEHVQKLGLKPDVMFYFTDLVVSRSGMPAKAPAYPVVWCSINKTRPHPFGDKIFIDIPKD